MTNESIERPAPAQNNPAGAGALLIFLAGASLGAAAALLLAPRPGSESRRLLRDYVQRTQQKVQEAVRMSGLGENEMMATSESGRPPRG